MAGINKLIKEAAKMQENIQRIQTDHPEAILSGIASESLLGAVNELNYVR